MVKGLFVNVLVNQIKRQKVLCSNFKTVPFDSSRFVGRKPKKKLFFQKKKN